MPSFRLISLGALLVAAATPKPMDPATTDRLGGPERFLTHVSTDKPVYRVGETVYVRGVVLDASTRAPLTRPGAQVTIKGPKGEALVTGGTMTVDGAFGFSWTIPEGTAGGEFTVVAAGTWGAAPGERRFDVRAYRPPRLTSQITFARDGYGPGDTVSATLETKRAEGGVPTGARITAVARVDGADVARAPCSLDAKGRCTVALALPATIERGEGTVAFTIEDGGVVETATKTIPLLVAAFDIALFPEGGDLVAGLPGRVYLEARTPAQKPADIAGVIVDSKGREVTTFRTEHEGRGRFALTPQQGERYTLKVTEPAGVKKSVPLPAVAPEGATLSAAAEVTAAGQPVKLTAGWTGDRVVTVTLRQRDLELSKVTLDARNQLTAPVSLDAKDAEGVLVATLATKDGTPLAERLVFREPKKKLSITLTPDRERSVPGAAVRLKVKTLVDGKPAPAFVGLTVTDEAVQELIDRREQAPALPAMVLLESDVRELADAQVYLDPKHPKARLAVDLLLGTQGWRRFAIMNVADFLVREQDEARRALAFMQPPMPASASLAEAGVKRRGGALAPASEAKVPMAVPPPAPRPAPAPALKPVAAPPAAAVPAQALEPQRKFAGRAAMADEAFAVVQFVTVREYAHQVRPDRKPNDRLDFAETLYWSAATKTDANGEATVSFGLSDAVTSFRVQAGGYTQAGVLGSAEATLESVKPFYVEPRLPLEVTEGDVVRLPVAFVNGTREPLSGMSLSLTTKADLRLKAPADFSLKADERARRVVEFTVPPRTRTAGLTLDAKAAGYSDVVTRELTVKPKGFPVAQTSGGLLTANGRARFDVKLAADTVPGSVTARVVIYPSPAGNLASALKTMVREPCGCFEQTSSTTYPMTMALQYFAAHTGAEPALVRDAQEKLERGYQRLTGYECKEKGYEWFGQDPGHEALTAYGLLQFTDMAQVRQVDAAMMARTKQWLLTQRDGKGGFERRRRALHTWVEDKDTSDAYITWALLEAGVKDLTAEVSRVKAAGGTSKNAYVVALAANVAQLSGDPTAAKALLQKLAGQQDERGFVTGATQSIVGSTGRSLGVETTALATLAWLRAGGDFVGPVEKAIKGLAEASTDGGYGSTQSTVLALRAVMAYDRARAAGRKPGSVRLLVDGKPLGAPVRYDGATMTELELPDASELLASGAHVLELVQEGGGQLPYSIAVRSHRAKPDSAAEVKVALEVALSASSLKEGDVAEATARVTNLTDAALPTVVAIVGVPGGLEPRIDQLKELVKSKAIDAYEVMGRDVVLYWRGMTPKEQRRVPVSLVAAVPGRYVGPASRAYLYYGDEHKAWVAGLGADIAAK